MNFARMTLLELSQRLASRALSSRELVEQALAAIDDPAGEGARTFIRVNRDTALANADRVDALRRTGASCDVT
ncbi:MAG: hypothetical protein IPO66_17280 [Rhodanobacteraceae bacterium]|nr:hypothetical protein [Rhodanobacteraceae bacterium]